MIINHYIIRFLEVEKRIDLLSRPKPLPHGFIDDRYEIQKQSCEGLLESNFLRITCGSSHLEVFLGKVVLKICSKFTGEHQCRRVISMKLQSILACVFSCKFAAYFQNTFP